MLFPRIDKTYRNFKRYREIVGVLFKYGFGHFLDRMHLSAYLHFGKKIFLRKKIPLERLSWPQRIRLALQELGPTFVKLGQVLSTRPFLIPYQLVIELSKLQDQVASFPFSQAKKILERELKVPLEQRFSYFEETPLASASLAQVHKAKTLDGKEVVVKIQRPGIKKIIEADMDILKDLASLIERYIPESKIFDPQGIVEELAKTIRKELDFVNEARNIEIFAANFKNDKTVYVSQVFWNLTTSLVLTTEWLKGVKISDLEALKQKGFDRKLLAQNGANLVLKQIFEDGFFHADPHPGNILVLENNIIAPVDFGMMGKLPDSMMNELADILIAALRGDSEKVVQVLLNTEIINENVNLKALEMEISEILYRYRKVPLSQINMRQITQDAFYLIHRYDIRMRSELMLLGKALVTYEEVGRMLDPGFEFASQAEPYIKKLAKQKFKSKVFLKDLISGLKETRDFFTVFPFELKRILRKLKKGELTVVLRHKDLERLILELDRSSNRLSFAFIIAAIIIGSSFIMQLDIGYKILGYPLLGILGFFFAGFLGVGLIIAILKSGRL